MNLNFRSVGGAIFMALEGPEEREICNQMREEIKERLEEQFFRLQVFYCIILSSQWLITYEWYMKTYQKEAENRTKLWNDKTIDFDLDLDIDEDFQEKDSYVTSRSGNPGSKLYFTLDRTRVVFGSRIPILV